MDKNGYPEDSELEHIEKWPSDFVALMEYVRERWHFAEWGWKQSRKYPAGGAFVKPFIRYKISTGGWSGNEEIIGAMQRNFLFWAMCWQQSKRGGHYVFEVTKEGK